MGLMPGHALLDQKIFAVDQFAFIDIVNSGETLFDICQFCCCHLYARRGLWLNARTLGWGIPHWGGGERRSAHPTFIILHIYTFKL